MCRHPAFPGGGLSSLLVIPARGGSNGIPHKAIRPLAGIAPIVRTLTMAQGAGQIIVVTDDAEIARLAKQQKTHVFPEPKLSTPPGHHSLDPVVYAVAVTAEDIWHQRYEQIATVQCTSPLLERATLDRCLEAGNALTVRDDRHLRIGGPWLPREQLPACWRVTGGCTVITRDLLRPDRRVMPNAKPIQVSGAEAIDLDTPDDWAMAEWYAGASTNRECLMARVLMERLLEAKGQTIVLSAWDERVSDGALRAMHLASLQPTITLYPNGDHTRAEAEQAIGERQNDDLTIVTSAYHQPRAFLTFLRVLHERGLERTVRLWNAPAPSRMEPLQDEWDKIVEYQARGHVASYEDGLAYLDWRDSCTA